MSVPVAILKQFVRVTKVAAAAGVDAVAILDSKGQPLAIGGDLDPMTARALAAFGTREAPSRELLARLNAGEILTTSLEDREVNIGVAAECMFVVVVMPRDRAALKWTAKDLVALVARIVAGAREGSSDFLPPPSSPGGSSSGPAELQVVEIGVSVPRGRN